MCDTLTNVLCLVSAASRATRPPSKVSPASPTNPLSLCPAGEKTEEWSSELAQDRFGSDYSDTKKNTKDANARANALAALIFIQFVISLAQVWVASTRLRLSKKADEPAIRLWPQAWTHEVVSVAKIL